MQITNFRILYAVTLSLEHSVMYENTIPRVLDPLKAPDAYV